MTTIRTYTFFALLVFVSSLPTYAQNGDDEYAVFLVCDTQQQIIDLSEMLVADESAFVESIDLVNAQAQEANPTKYEHRNACSGRAIYDFHVVDEYKTVLLAHHTHMVGKIVVQALWIGRPLPIRPIIMHALMPYVDTAL